MNPSSDIVQLGFGGSGYGWGLFIEQTGFLQNLG